MAYFTSRKCKVRYADESRGRGRYPMGWLENEITTFSRDAQIKTADSPQAVNVVDVAKRKKKLQCCYTTSSVFLRSLSDLKEKYTTAFRQTYSQLHYLSRNKNKARSRLQWSQMRATFQTMDDYYITHTVCTFKMMYCTMHCNNFQFAIHLMTVGLLNIAVFQYLRCQDQRISRTCISTFISCSSRNLFSAWSYQISAVSDTKHADRNNARRWTCGYLSDTDNRILQLNTCKNLANWLWD